jgi:hypothetical protein
MVNTRAGDQFEAARSDGELTQRILAIAAAGT